MERSTGLKTLNGCASLISSPLLVFLGASLPNTVSNQGGEFHYLEVIFSRVKMNDVSSTKLYFRTLPADYIFSVSLEKNLPKKL
jgi:hypothetical protein